MTENEHVRETVGFRCPDCDMWHPGAITTEKGYVVERDQIVVNEDGEPTGLILGTPVATTLYRVPCDGCFPEVITDVRPETGPVYACPVCESWYPRQDLAVACCGPDDST